MTTPAPPSQGFDPEAEQEVDFAKYVRLLGARWWLLVAGLVVGAVIVDGVAYAGSFSHRIVGIAVRSGRRVLTFPHGDYVPVSGNGMRLLLHGFSRLYAVEPKRPARRQLAR